MSPGDPGLLALPALSHADNFMEPNDAQRRGASLASWDCARCCGRGLPLIVRTAAEMLTWASLEASVDTRKRRDSGGAPRAARTRSGRLGRSDQRHLESPFIGGCSITAGRPPAEATGRSLPVPFFYVALMTLPFLISAVNHLIPSWTFSN